MKTTTILIMLFSTITLAQIRGNNQTETRSFPISSLEVIEMQFYAQLTIDNSIDEGMKITAESNLFEHINTSVKNGKLLLDQKKWIEPNQKIIIIIGAPNLKEVIHGTHDKTEIINLNNNLTVNAELGTVIVEGTSNELYLNSKKGIIDAQKVAVKNVYATINESGKVFCNPIEYLWANISNDGTLIYTEEPLKSDIKTSPNGTVTIASQHKKEKKKKKLEWISFKIKNNSAKRNHFVVKGPRSDGGTFSYGFSLMPFLKKKETWPVGTKIYKENKLGLKKLLVTIKAEDEATVVKLFE